MKTYLQLLICMIVFLGSNGNVHAQIIAFPGAEGAGKNTTGGRGTNLVASKVFAVTSLADDGSAGTLRWALTQNATYRTIIFRISGTIHLLSPLKITKANTTIAGQTAPGEGICLADHPVSVSADNVIIRYLRFRLGDKNQNKGKVDGSGNDDAFDGTGRNKIIIDHCTMSWSDDEACSFYRGDSVTLQWNMISEPLNYSYHFETGDADFEHHGYGGIWGGAHATFHHNLIAHCAGRAPRFDGSRNLGNGSTPGLENVDFTNNVIYDWGNYNVNGGEGGNYNIVNNYYKYGPNTSSSTSSGVRVRQEIINPFEQASPALPYGKYFLSGNYVDAASAVTASNWKGASFSGGSLAGSATSKVTTRFVIVPINIESAADAYNSVLNGVGCSLPNRDTLDQRIINDVIDRAGKIIDVQGGYPHGTDYAQTVNAWPALLSTTPPTTTNTDNIPDQWLAQRGLTAAALSGAAGYHSNGYTHLENFLNGDSIVAPGIVEQCIYFRPVTFTNSGKWIDIKDTTYGYYASDSYMVSTDTNNIAASIFDNGSYGTLSGSYYTTATTRYTLASLPSSGNRAYLNRNIHFNYLAVSQPVNVRLYFTKVEFESLKAADPSINSIADLAVYIEGSADADDPDCVNQMVTFGQKFVPTSYGTYGTYQTGYYLEFTVSTGLHNFFIGANDEPLPLKLISFTASSNNNNVKLNWITQNEVDTKNFMIEKSTNGQNFDAIGNVNANNNILTNHYYFTDNGPLNSNVYYRIKMIDIDGTYSYSQIEMVEAGGSPQLKVTPNPADQNITVSYPKTTTLSYLQIVSSEGKVIYQRSVMAGSTSSYMNIVSLQKGVYEVVIKGSTGSLLTRFVKQ